MSEQTPTVHRDGRTDLATADGVNAEERQYLLSSPARRAALAVLAENASTMTLADLASKMAATGGDASVDEDVRDLKLVLHHNHLPRLAEAGLVEYDASANSVRPRTERLPVLG
jgi:hypothetical protein